MQVIAGCLLIAVGWAVLRTLATLRRINEESEFHDDADSAVCRDIEDIPTAKIPFESLEDTARVWRKQHRGQS